MAQSYSALFHQPTSMLRSFRLLSLVGAFLLVSFAFIWIRSFNYEPSENLKNHLQTGPSSGNAGTGPGSGSGSFKFSPPVASVQHNVIRGDNVIWTLDDSTTWQAVGRHPNRPECWTYEDRFGVYKKPSPEMRALVSDNNKNNNKNKRAVVLRLAANHLWKDQFTYHARALVLEAGYLAKYDVIIYIHLDMDESGRAAWLKRVPEEFLPLVQTFSTQELKEWIPKGTFKNVFEQNHTPIQMFMAKNPKYDFVYTVEADLRLIGRWDTFLADIDNEYSFHQKNQKNDQTMPLVPDLVTFESPRRPKPEWEWTKKESQCVQRFGGLGNIRATLGVMWGWSRRLTDALTKYNEQGMNCYYEYFAPSIAYKENLTTFFYQHPLYCPRASPSERNSLKQTELGKNDPRLVQYDKVAVGCTYYFVPKHSQPFWESWYHNPSVCRPPALVHPVKGDFFN